MTVRELIELLQNEHPDADVLVECAVYAVDESGMPVNAASDVEKAVSVKEHNGTGTLAVLIKSEVDDLSAF